MLRAARAGQSGDPLQVSLPRKLTCTVVSSLSGSYIDAFFPPGRSDTSFPPGRSAALLSQVVALDQESGRGDGELARGGGGGVQVEPEARLTESVPLPPDPTCV